MTVTAEEAFRRLTMGETSIVEPVHDGTRPEVLPWHLDGRTEALLRLGALVALDAPASSYRGVVEAAQRSGARFEDLLAVLAVLLGPVGSARVVSAAPKIALAAGYDVEAALE
jgi:alkylhydroperoxidase/carboxymuconolactone decarboxylase family protein YurZ